MTKSKRLGYSNISRRAAVERLRSLRPLQTLMPGVPRSPRETFISLQLLTWLRAQGWQRTVGCGTPVSAKGEPQPWFTYSAIRWLERSLMPGVRAFEYGAGSSTSWFARDGRIKEIVSVEHDQRWFAQLPQPPNGQILHVPYDGDCWTADDSVPYVRAIANGSPWDVVIIDGMARNTCARVVGNYLSPSGLVILDDTENVELLPAQAALARQGLGRIDFWGVKPGIGSLRCTTVFSRDFNAWLVPDQT